MYICMYDIRMYVCMYYVSHVCTYICMYTARTHMHTYVCKFMYVYIYIYVYRMYDIYIYIYIYIYTYTHTHHLSIQQNKMHNMSNKFVCIALGHAQYVIRCHCIKQQIILSLLHYQGIPSMLFVATLSDNLEMVKYVSERSSKESFLATGTLGDVVGDHVLWKKHCTLVCMYVYMYVCILHIHKYI